MVCWRVCWCHFVDGGVNRWCGCQCANLCCSRRASEAIFCGTEKNKDKEIRTKQDEICLPQNIGQ